MIGKVSPEKLKELVFSRTGTKEKDLIVGPRYGEDTAALDLDGKILVINSDPIIFAADRIGNLGVIIASNDIAASGAKPRWMTNVFFLPERDKDVLDKITKQIDKEASRLKITIVGGHSEYVPEISRLFISMTCIGTTDRYIPSSGAKLGDKIVLTKGAGIEGTGIIATDFREELEGKIQENIIAKGEKMLDRMSVLEEGLILSKYANSMHDPTEGGVIDGLLEVAYASMTKMEVKRNKIPISEETKVICRAMDVDPLRIFSSGALLATVPSEDVREAITELDDKGIKASEIGEVKKTDKPKVELGSNIYQEPVRDALYDLWKN